MELLRIVKLFTDFIFCIFHEAWSFVLTIQDGWNCLTSVCISAMEYTFVFTWPNTKMKDWNTTLCSGYSNLGYVFNNSYIGSTPGFYSCDGWNETTTLKNSRIWACINCWNCDKHIRKLCQEDGINACTVVQSNILYLSLALMNIVKNKWSLKDPYIAKRLVKEIFVPINPSIHVYISH